MSEALLARAKGFARRLVEATALNGVSIRYPEVNPTTKTWRLFDQVANAYIETPYTAIGQSPHVGENGNWWIGDSDTGVKASVKGDPGEVAVFREHDGKCQYRYPSEAPEVWHDAFAIPVGTKTFTHTQDDPSDEWLIQHNLGSIGVSAVVVDDEDNEVIGYIDRANSTMNLLVIRFGVPLAGKAYIKF